MANHHHPNKIKDLFSLDSVLAYFFLLHLFGEMGMTLIGLLYISSKMTLLPFCIFTLLGILKMIYFNFGRYFFYLNRIIYEVKSTESNLIVSYTYLYFLYSKSELKISDCFIVKAHKFNYRTILSSGYLLLCDGKIIGTIPDGSLANVLVKSKEYLNEIQILPEIPQSYREMKGELPSFYELFIPKKWRR